MTTVYTFSVEIPMDIEYLADVIYEGTMDYISDNYEVEEIPKETKLQILKDAARYILANF